MHDYVSIGASTSAQDQAGILALQCRNLAWHLTLEQRTRDGFLLVEHAPDVLARMAEAAPQIVAKVGDDVVAYALTMLTTFRDWVPALVPMFDTFEKLTYEGRQLADWRYYVIGQICVAEAYRGQGLVSRLYQHHRETFASDFDLCVTEIAADNLRSMRAHEKIGFRVLHTFTDATTRWNIVVWPWRPPQVPHVP